MKKIRFAIYYLRVRVSVYTGWRDTMNPIDIKWRWRYWSKVQKVKRQNS